jgi:hypothetical protein
MSYVLPVIHSQRPSAISDGERKNLTVQVAYNDRTGTGGTHRETPLFRAASITTGVIWTLALALGLGMTSVPAFADTAPAAPAAAAATTDVAQAGMFDDVPLSHWAYDAVQQLGQEGYIKGYPDGKFKGARPMTRYEVAALVARADTAIREAIATSQQVKPADIAALKALLAEFGKEVKDIQARVAALETKTAALQRQTASLQTQETATQTEADASRLAITRAHFNYNMAFRPGTDTQNFQVLNGPTATAGAAPYTYLVDGAVAATGPTPGTRGTAYSFGPGGLNSIVPGVTGQGVQYWFARIGFNGQIDHGWSYGARITTSGIKQENPNGTSTSNVGYCTGLSVTNCSYDDLSNTQGAIPVVMEFAYTQWTSPGGIYGAVGKFPVGEGNYTLNPIAQLFAGQNISGATAGYRSSDGNLQTSFIYGYAPVTATTLAGTNVNLAPGAAAGAINSVCAINVVGMNRGNNVGGWSNFNPNCNGTQQEFGYSFSYRVAKTRTVFDVSEDYFTQKPDPLWDPAAVSCTVPVSPVNVAGTFTAVNAVGCTANGGHVNTAVGGAGNYLTGQTNIGTWEVAVAQYIGNQVRPQFQLGASLTNRMGYDPFTGIAWQGAQSFVASATWASKGNLNAVAPVALIPATGTSGSNVIQFAFEQYGLNSLYGIDSGPTAGTPVWGNNLGLANLNGLQTYTFQYAHWFTDNIRVGIVGVHAQNIPGVGLPIGASGTGGVNGCPGCSGSLQLNQVDLETFLVM